ncbi:MAG: hypothetical protein ACI4DW_13130 [Lachnospiraceae bacterium]
MYELFESRRNVEDLMLILQQWIEEHPKDNKAKYAEELFEKLDYIHMTW